MTGMGVISLVQNKANCEGKSHTKSAFMGRFQRGKIVISEIMGPRFHHLWN